MSRPADLEEVAFWPLTHLARLVETRQVSSLELTDMYLARLERLNPVLNCVVTLTADRARQQAQEADEEIAAGSYRGPLHGIPWGAKDIIAVRGYRTTWGVGAFEDRVLDVDATVVERLDAAGRGAGRQAHHRRAGLRPQLVRRAHQQPVEPGGGLQRVVRRLGIGGWRGAGGVRDRDRHRRVHPLAVDPLRRRRPPPDLRAGSPATG